MSLPRIATPKYELTIPSSNKVVKYRPFLVKEEKILLLALESEDESQIMNAVTDIIDNCVTDDVDAKNLAMFDLEYIFLQLRAKSKGEDLNLEVPCGKCDTPIPFNLNLLDVKVSHTDGHTNKIPLAEDVGVIMKYPSIKLKEGLNEGEGSSEVENIFSSLIGCLDSIWDKDSTYSAKDHTHKELEDFFESLPEKEFAKIQDFFSTMPVLRHKVDLKCNAKIGKGKDKKVCGWKDTKVLEGLQSFFA
tara:strand:- start:12764 stop:13504 length:741 start_codon:yes stop_codon:yes gene_type:complete